MFLSWAGPALRTFNANTPSRGTVKKRGPGDAAVQRGHGRPAGLAGSQRMGWACRCVRACSAALAIREAAACGGEACIAPSPACLSSGGRTELGRGPDLDYAWAYMLGPICFLFEPQSLVVTEAQYGTSKPVIGGLAYFQRSSPLPEMQQKNLDSRLAVAQ